MRSIGQMRVGITGLVWVHDTMPTAGIWTMWAGDGTLLIAIAMGHGPATDGPISSRTISIVSWLQSGSALPSTTYGVISPAHVTPFRLLSKRLPHHLRHTADRSCGAHPNLELATVQHTGHAEPQER